MRRIKEKAEIVIKEGFLLWGGGPVIAKPAITILATPAGFAWLSQYFGKLAKRKVHVDLNDPDDHGHLSYLQAPVNRKLSDAIEIRVGTLLAKNRRAVFKKYGVSTRSTKVGDMIHRFERMCADAQNAMRATSRSSSPRGRHKLRDVGKNKKK